MNQQELAEKIAALLKADKARLLTEIAKQVKKSPSTIVKSIGTFR